MELKSFATDESKKKEGIWVEFEGARFKIKSTDSPQYRRAVDRAAKRRSPTKVRKDIETQTEIGIEGIADGVLLDWEGLTDGGEPVECTRENKIRVLTAVPPLRDFLATEAAAMANFSAERVVADAEDFRESD